MAKDYTQMLLLPIASKPMQLEDNDAPEVRLDADGRLA